MPVLWNKLDSSLGSRYGSFLREGADATLLVSLFYEGDLAAIEATGFETVFRGDPGYATGKVHLSGLEQIAAHPGVVRLSFGQRPRPRLDETVSQINARPDVWDWDAAVSQFVPASGTKGTGKGVLIGIIDTGIDWRHPFFLAETEPIKVTRIRAIWDAGLLPDDDEVAAGPPDPSLLTGEAGGSYGIEYNFARIQAAVNDGPSIRHRDCHGHGTHVASIAAGNGGPSRSFVGVAPEAELIVVKAFSLQNAPKMADGVTEIGFDIIMRDAVTYILNKARAAGKPVVINVSLGRSLGPHDGFTDIEDWLTKTFDGKPGICFVTAAGNEAAGDMHAIIKPDGAAEIDFDIELRDGRSVPDREGYTKCRFEDETPDTLDFQIYYPPDAGPITVGIKARDATDFMQGPDRGDPDVTHHYDGFDFFMMHFLEPLPRGSTGRGPLQRSLFWLQMVGKKDPAGKRPRFRPDRYNVHISAPAALRAHFWCDQLGELFYLKVLKPVPDEVQLTDRFLISTYGGAANVVTVAAHHHISDTEVRRVSTSSPGPLVNYDHPTDPHPVEKPDVAAPGLDIHAALSRETFDRKKQRKRADQVTAKHGTSMAAPHVAGVVALMLENKPSLTSTQILDKLRNEGRHEVPVIQRSELGQGRVDAKLAFDAALTP